MACGYLEKYFWNSEKNCEVWKMFLNLEKKLEILTKFWNLWKKLKFGKDLEVWKRFGNINKNWKFGGKCTSCQLASKDTDRSWVGSRDSKGEEQSYLDYSTWYNVFRYREVLTKYRLTNNHN